MLLNDFTNILEKTECLTNYNKNLKNLEDASLSVVSSIRALLVAIAYTKNIHCGLVIVPGIDSAKSFYNELKVYLGSEKVLFFEEAYFGNLESEKAPIRMECIDVLTSGLEKIVVTSSSNIIRLISDLCIKNCSPINLEVDNEYDYEKLVKKLIDFGYVKLPILDGPGTFSAKGGTIDIFIAQQGISVRLDFFGDELEEIKRIVISTGQAISQLDSVEIYPCKNIIYSSKDAYNAKVKLSPKARTNTKFNEYLEKLDNKINFEQIRYLEPMLSKKMHTLSDVINENVVIYNNEPKAILDDVIKTYESKINNFNEKFFNAKDYYCAATRLNFSKFVHIDYQSIMLFGHKDCEKLVLKHPKKHNTLEELIDVLKYYKQDGYYIILSIPNVDARKNLSMDLVEHGFSIINVNNNSKNSHLKKHIINITDFIFKQSFVIPDAKLCVLTLNNSSISANINMKNYSTNNLNYIDITKITFPYNPGDYVVHVNYGVAKFKEIVKRKFANTVKDFLLLEYAQNDKLYVPVEHFDRVTKYVGPQGQNPKITRLGTKDWSCILNRANKASRKMAFDLVDIYSKRELAKGYAFKIDTDCQKLVEYDFPYTETKDQLNAISDVKQDMHSIKPMDRLICGDVGFGKTEVAIRSAFICADNKMQTMILCPTTILAQQHYSTFSERLSKYNVNIKILCRFNTTKETKEIIENFKLGKIDILIGTHRLLSRDICPKNLGLVIIDEEQRFGVTHKEHLKNFRDSVDVLTLSATPIPRTMQMACSGVRDMSLILTPPSNRQNVEVYVGEWNIDLVCDAIRNELQRKGQVYYLSNKVKTIKNTVEKLTNIVGEAKISYAHGKMNKAQLKEIMDSFNSGKTDVLVSTTIIENGIDNPNTNTLIVEDSQNFGLSQMYQLKGRVGRSCLKAYAYFLFTEKSVLSKEAVMRLSAIDEFSALGSGMQIALKDLEIRGAGNFLGTEQSGNISHVGFDLFAQMLKNAVEKIQNNVEVTNIVSEAEQLISKTISSVVVNIPGNYYISDSDVDDIEEKILWYRKFANTKSLEEVSMYEIEFLNSIQQPSDSSINFIVKAKVCAWCLKQNISMVSIFNNQLILEGKKLDISQQKNIIRKKGRYFDSSKKIIFKINELSFNDSENLISEIYLFLTNLF